jgi:hypothetical protein
MDTGNKYEETKNLTTTQIAALVRRELRAAQKTRGFRCSVKTDHFSGGSAIRVRLDFPEDADRVNAATTIQWAREILDQYNRQDVDLLTDYFDVRFYGTVTCNLHPLPYLARDVEEE